MTISNVVYNGFNPENNNAINRESKEKDPVSDVMSKVLTSFHLSPENRAAITFQRFARGYLVRKAFLSRDIYQNFVALWKNTKQILPMSLAEGGKTRVWLPMDVPEIVLKESGREFAKKRFHKMQSTRSVLSSQGSKNLIIPKARLFEKYLVEERLPINIDYFYNMAIYQNEPHLFDDVVREMTRLFSKAFLKDILNTRSIFTWNQFVGDSIRYDNLPLYIVEENGKRVGKIGLIDLERLKLESNPKGLETLARIFPYHIDLITEEAIKLKMDIDQPAIQKAADNGNRFLQRGYLDHLEWLKAKNVMKAFAKKTRYEKVDEYHAKLRIYLPLKIEPDRMAALIQIVERELLRLNRGENDVYLWREWSPVQPPKDFITKDPQKVAQELSYTICPKIIERLNQCIMKHQTENLLNIGGEIRSEPDIIMLRSPIFKRFELNKGIGEMFSEHPQVDLRNRLGDSQYMAEQLVHYVVEGLVQGGEFFSFDPGYYSAGHQFFWIRY